MWKEMERESSLTTRSTKRMCFYGESSLFQERQCSHFSAVAQGMNKAEEND